MKRLISLLMAIALLAPGCGTFQQMTHGEGPAVFGGVRYYLSNGPVAAVDMLASAPTPKSGYQLTGANMFGTKGTYALLFGVSALDMPFTILADTLLLPFSIINEAKRGGIDTDH